MNKINKKGQVTIFIILALVIFFVILAMGALYKEDISNFFNKDINIYNEISNCIDETVYSTIDELLEKGGVLEPELTLRYLGKNYTYLCYTGESFSKCYTTQPMFLTTVQKTLKEKTEEGIKKCFEGTITELEKRNYIVNQQPLNYSLEIVPSSIVVNIEKPFTTIKGESVQSFSDFGFEVNSKLSELLILANKIASSQSEYCSFDSNAYTMMYRNYRIREKSYRGSKVYFVSDRNSNEEIKFATRSCVLE